MIAAPTVQAACQAEWKTAPPSRVESGFGIHHNTDKPMKRFFLAAATLLVGSTLAQTPDLRQIMADPQWIGPSVERSWWQLDGEAIYYLVEREDSELRDIRRIELASGEDRVVDYAGQAGIDDADPVHHPATGRVVFARDGNLFARL